MNKFFKNQKYYTFVSMLSKTLGGMDGEDCTFMTLGIYIKMKTCFIMIFVLLERFTVA